jgi:hypothetical protein
VFPLLDFYKNLYNGAPKLCRLLNGRAAQGNSTEGIQQSTIFAQINMTLYILGQSALRFMSHVTPFSQSQISCAYMTNFISRTLYTSSVDCRVTLAADKKIKWELLILTGKQ